MIYGPHNGDEKRLNPFKILRDRMNHSVKLYRFWLVRLVCNFCNQVRMNNPIAQGKADVTAIDGVPTHTSRAKDHRHRDEHLGHQEEGQAHRRRIRQVPAVQDGCQVSLAWAPARRTLRESDADSRMSNCLSIVARQARARPTTLQVGKKSSPTPLRRTAAGAR